MHPIVSRIISILLLLLFSFGEMLAQDCKLTLEGKINDEATNLPLENVKIIIQEKNIFVYTDSNGFFKITNLCPTDYHLVFSHFNCEAKKEFIQLKENTVLNQTMHHHSELISEVTIHGNKGIASISASKTINRQEIENQNYKNISDILSQSAGIQTIKTGSTISKPIIHGMYGNRISFVNNGIIQSGQQWGNDHAPEIDPFAADHITVIKGANSLQYGNASLGGTVLVEVEKIKPDPHFHGKVGYFYQTNGRGHALNLQLQRSEKWFSWRVRGTMLKQGDGFTPNYFLTNSGKEEKTLSVQLEKNIKEKWFLGYYYSLFNTTLGILRGSHISNLTDLQSALIRDVPFNTSENFSYSIHAPRQEVTHHLSKMEATHFVDNFTKWQFKYGLQLNQRQEFDIRRGNNPLPSVDMSQWNHFVEILFDKETSKHLEYKLGSQSIFVDNNNDLGTGITPFIPNYYQMGQTFFGILHQSKNTWDFELGAKIDYKSINSYYFEGNNGITFNKGFLGGSVYAGMEKEWKKDFKSKLNLGLTSRSPEVNELLSKGLHQGLSSIEEGNISLKNETSFKSTLSFEGFLIKKISFNALGYFQFVKDYIYLQPQKEFRVTIRGAFPVYNTVQNNVSIFGTDLSLNYEVNANLKTSLMYNITRGNNLDSGNYLIHMPSDRIMGTLNFNFRAIKSQNWNPTEIQFISQYFFKQNRWNPNQEFLAPPSAYILFGGSISNEFKFFKNFHKISLTVDNIFNQSYRNYLNRQRFFADELGRNLVLKLDFRF